MSIWPPRLSVKDVSKLMSWFSPSFSNALVNATASKLLLESFAGKSDSVAAFQLTLPDPGVFIAPDGIADFGIAQAIHCNHVCYSFVLRIDWLKPILTDYAIICSVNGLRNFICLWCNTTIVTRVATLISWWKTLDSPIKTPDYVLSIILLKWCNASLL